MNKNKIKPLGVKVISTYYIIVSALTVLLGIIMSSFPSKIREYVLQSTPEFATIEPSIAVKAILVTGIFFIIFGLLGIILGMGLFKLKSWARYTIILFSLFGFFFATTGLISGQWSNIVGFLINGFIAWYLIFNKEVKKAIKGE